MKILIVGGGASALICANIIKEYDEQSEVLIIEQNDKLGKKLKLTGNGKCNIAPALDDIHAYNNPEFVSNLFSDVPFTNYLQTLEDLGIPTKTIKNQGYYPLSENAPNVVRILENNLLNKGVKILNGEVVDYLDNLEIILKDGSHIKADKVIFATGGKSYAKSGSNGAVFEILRKHGYQINELKPSLCPIKVKENIKSLFGARAHAILKLLQNDKVVYQEDGEVMFKKDAISGIAAMNASSYIVHHPGKYKIVINFLSDNFTDSFVINKNISSIDALLSYVSYPIADYISRRFNIPQNDPFIKHASKIKEILSNLSFEYDSLYDFESAQITAGGIDLKQIGEGFSSKKEKNVYFVGEMLDIDGLCGGYNLRFALSSAIACAEYITK